MSQNYFNVPIYEPHLLGHPCQIGEAQITEPFWQQYPLWAPPKHINDIKPIHPHNSYYRYTMDAQTLVIGYNTKDGHKLPESVNKSTGRPNLGDDKPRPKGKVDVYIGGVFIQAVPLGLLVRFSTAARDAFPRPETKAENGEKKEGKGGDWADYESEYVDVGELTAETAKLKQPSEPADATTSISEDLHFKRTVQDDHGPKKKLDLHLSTLWIQPSIEAFKFAFDWMYEARRTSNGEKLLKYGVPNPEKIPFTKLVDLYAASLCLGLRPPAGQLRSDIFVHLTENPPFLNDLVYIHEHLPVDDSVITRTITSFLQNRGASVKYYTKSQRDEIEHYFETVDLALYDRFWDIVSHRENRRQARMFNRGAEKLQKTAEGLDTGENGVKENGAKTTSGNAEKSDPGEGNSRGGRRDRRKNENAKGVSGKARASN